jgi:hypothetical protein
MLPSEKLRRVALVRTTRRNMQEDGILPEECFHNPVDHFNMLKSANDLNYFTVFLFIYLYGETKRISVSGRIPHKFVLILTANLKSLIEILLYRDI